MSFKKMFFSAVIVAAVLAFTASVMAGECKMMGKMGGKSCPMMKGEKGMMGGHGMSGKCAMGRDCHGKSGHGASKCPIASKAMWLSHELLENRTQLGLTAEEVSRIKEIKLDIAKGYLRQGAEMQIFMLDMKAALSQDKVDVEKIESMIDSGMAGMATASKASVKAYAELKGIATPERMAKIKAAHHSAPAMEAAHDH